MAEKLAAPSMHRLHHVSSAHFVDVCEVYFARTNELVRVVLLVVPDVDFKLLLKISTQGGEERKTMRRQASLG